MAVCRKTSLFLLGFGLGALSGVLLAPKSGREIREELFGGTVDIIGEPGAEAGAPFLEEVENEAELKARIEETRARLKAEIEEQD